MTLIIILAIILLGIGFYAFRKRSYPKANGTGADYPTQDPKRPDDKERG